MYIINNKNQDCFEIQEVLGNKDYKLSFNIDGDFHLRFDMLDKETKQHTGYLTGTVYSDEGHYEYILTPKADGIMCVNKSKDKINTWNVMKNIEVTEVGK